MLFPGWVFRLGPPAFGQIAEIEAGPTGRQLRARRSDITGEKSPLMHQRLIQAIDDQLSAKGLQKTDANSDLSVTYHGESTTMLVLDQVGYYDGWYRYGGIGVSTVRARSYEQGTLVVDLVDAEQNRLVWRGVATDTVAGSPDAQTKQIETAIRQMFRRYPPAN